MVNPLAYVIGHSRDRSVVIHECRACGTTVDQESETCPACGSEEIAVYEFDVST